MESLLHNAEVTRLLKFKPIGKELTILFIEVV
jgi:hypothetical protein